ncbi:MAG: EutN/CcmL family microcompartment protein [Candidatus Sulfopaludibacter sp.]|nr:EutN/CcmL family microcompartment protein [Candidatus Sulfopaludibacter sp.]
MYLGRVIGCLWASVKNQSMVGQRLLVVQPLTPELKETGKCLVCGDSTGAGAGELIYWVRGKEASFPFLPTEPPFDTSIVGIVDSVHVKRPDPPAAPAAESGKRKRKS